MPSDIGKSLALTRLGSIGLYNVLIGERFLGHVGEVLAAFKRFAREFAQRASAPVHAPRYNPLVAVVLVILAAAAAATTVYFLLPLLT